MNCNPLSASKEYGMTKERFDIGKGGKLFSTSVSLLAYVWPMPCTILGLLIAAIPFTGTRHVFIYRGTIAIVGPGIGRLLARAPITGGAAAITFGHTILAQSREAFLLTFEHELVHVRQYQWWGPFFLPAYGINSLWHWSRGDDAYLDNDFERQARKWSQ
jgi:hypothetical protein